MNLKKEDKIKSKLLINEDEIWEETLDIASKILSITKAGDVIFNIPTSKITLKDKILLCIIGKRYAFEASILDDESVSLDELSRTLHSERKVLSARASELIRENKLKIKERGTYKLAYFDLKKYLEETVKNFS